MSPAVVPVALRNLLLAVQEGRISAIPPEFQGDLPRYTIRPAREKRNDVLRPTMWGREAKRRGLVMHVSVIDKPWETREPVQLTAEGTSLLARLT